MDRHRYETKKETDIDIREQETAKRGQKKEKNENCKTEFFFNYIYF